MAGSITTDAFIQNLPPSSLNGLVRAREVSRSKAFVQSLNLNAAAPVDLTPIVLPAGVTLYIPVSAWVYNPTGNMSSATLGLFTAAAGGGTTVITPVALSTLTGAGKFQVLSIAALTSPLSATSLIPRLTVASGVAGTAALVLEFIDLSLI